MESLDGKKGNEKQWLQFNLAASGFREWQQCKILIKGSGKYHEENLCYQHIELLASSL